MNIGTNSLNQIKQVGEISDPNLLIITLDENSESYPFKGWSDTKILCYCYQQTVHGVSVYPYIDPNIIEKIESDNDKILQARADIDFIAIMVDVDLGV